MDQVGAAQVGAGQVGIDQVGVAQVGAPQIAAHQVSASQVGKRSNLGIAYGHRPFRRQGDALSRFTLIEIRFDALYGVAGLDQPGVQQKPQIPGSQSGLPVLISSKIRAASALNISAL